MALNLNFLKPKNKLLEKRNKKGKNTRNTDNYCGACASNFTDGQASSMLLPLTGSDIYQMTANKTYEAFKQVQKFITDFATDRIRAGVVLRVSIGDIQWGWEATPSTIFTQVYLMVVGSGSTDRDKTVTVIVKGMNRGMEVSMGSYMGYLYLTGLNESQSITGMQSLLLSNLFNQFLPYQVVGQAVAVEPIRSVPGETPEQIRARELQAIADAKAKYLADQTALAQRQQEERLTSESIRQTTEAVYNIQQSEADMRAQEEANRRAIEANRTLNQQAQTQAQIVTQNAQLATEQKAAELLRQKAIAKATAKATATEAARMKALTTALPDKTAVSIGNNSVVEKLGLTSTFQKIGGAFRTEEDPDRFILDAATGDFINQDGEVFDESDLEKDDTGKLVKKPFYKKWWFWLIVVLLLAGGGGAFYYFKYYKK